MVGIIRVPIEKKEYVGIVYKNEHDPTGPKNIAAMSQQDFRSIFDQCGITPDGKYFISSTKFSKIFCSDSLELYQWIFSEIDLIRLRDRKRGINAMNQLCMEDKEKYHDKFCVMAGSHVLGAFSTKDEADDKVKELIGLDTYVYHFTS